MDIKEKKKAIKTSHIRDRLRALARVGHNYIR